MKKSTKRIILASLVAALAIPMAAHAADDDLQKKLDRLSKEVAELKN